LDNGLLGRTVRERIEVHLTVVVNKLELDSTKKKILNVYFKKKYNEKNIYKIYCVGPAVSVIPLTNNRFLGALDCFRREDKTRGGR